MKPETEHLVKTITVHVCAIVAAVYATPSVGADNAIAAFFAFQATGRLLGIIADRIAP
jgi:hypothetical protein